jgi:hypothetical protein
MAALAAVAQITLPQAPETPQTFLQAKAIMAAPEPDQQRYQITALVVEEAQAQRAVLALLLPVVMAATVLLHLFLAAVSLMLAAVAVGLPLEVQQDQVEPVAAVAQEIQRPE